MLTLIDVVILIGVIGIIYFGFRTGFLRLVSFWLGTLAGSWLATRYGTVLAKKTSLNPVFTYLIISFLGFLVVVFLGLILSKIFCLVLLGWLDHLLGMLCGIFLAITLILVMSGLLPHSNSRLLSYCRQKIPVLGLKNRFLPELPKSPYEYQKNIQRVNQELKKISKEIDKHLSNP